MVMVDLLLPSRCNSPPVDTHDAVDRTKIISVSAGENSILFLYTLLLSEITLWDAVPPQWSQSQSLFSSQNDIMLIKRRQMHRTSYPLR
jgi:hypothetical protein